MILIKIRGALTLAIHVLVLMFFIPLAFATSSVQSSFSTPEGAVEALISALKTENEAKLLEIFGEEHKKLVVTGDKAYDAVKRSNFVKRFETFHILEKKTEDRQILLIGSEAWPAPIPLVRENGLWRFATEEGIEEIINRRIGSNEQNAIHVLQAYWSAQNQYRSADRLGDGVLQYAQNLVSSEGKHDGLYWPIEASKDQVESPFEHIISEGGEYLEEHDKGDAYQGYYFKILTSQGKNAAGGSYHYIINGRMIAGFGLIAYPAQYGDSGVMTFMINQNGKIFETDLGVNTETIAKKITSFNPGPSWRVIFNHLAS
jgi:hypothetical protein